MKHVVLEQRVEHGKYCKPGSRCWI